MQLCAVVGRPVGRDDQDELAGADLGSSPARHAHLDALDRWLTAATGAGTPPNWPDGWLGAGVPAAVVIPPPGLAENPQIRHRGLFESRASTRSPAGPAHAGASVLHDGRRPGYEGPHRCSASTTTRCSTSSGSTPPSAPPCAAGHHRRGAGRRMSSGGGGERDQPPVSRRGHRRGLQLAAGPRAGGATTARPSPWGRPGGARRRRAHATRHRRGGRGRGRHRLRLPEPDRARVAVDVRRRHPGGARSRLGHRRRLRHDRPHRRRLPPAPTPSGPPPPRGPGRPTSSSPRFGMFTAAEFALMARRHMEVYGTTTESLATVAATIRNNGHVNPEAVYYGRGPFTPQDILDSRMIADPFHLLDCAMTSEGGCALVLARAEVAGDLAKPPVFVLGGSTDHYGPAYKNPPSFDLPGRRRPRPGQRVGRTRRPRETVLRHVRARTERTSTSASSTTRSASRSSASSRRSASARRARGESSCSAGPSAKAAGIRSPPTAA